MSSQFFPRAIYPEVKKHLSAKQITVITGMRRVGKTTLIKQLLSEITSTNKVYLDLQQINNRELFASKNFDDVLMHLKQAGLRATEKMYVALDEIQLYPEISGVMKYLYDTYDIKFIVTGSSSYYLKNLFSESLAGRKRIFELFPLNFGEYLTFRQVAWLQNNIDFAKMKFSAHEYERLRAYYAEYIEFGGFPEVTLMNGIDDKKSMLNDIISSYVNIDIKSLADFRDSGSIYNLIKMLAARVGTRLDNSKLSRLTGLSRITVANYVSLFEKTYLISLVQVHTHNVDREIVKAKKIYFADNGLVNILAEVGSGTKFENSIFNQLRQRGDVRYYALKNGQEIDFVLDRRIALETKETPTIDDETTLLALSKMAGIKEFRIIGRHAAPKYRNYIWGGDIK